MIYVGPDKKSFHNTFKFILRLGNVLGLLPISRAASSEIVFKWKSWIFLYTLLTACTFITNAVICVVNWTFVSFSFRHLATQLHQLNAVFSLFLYVRLAKKWPKFAKLWVEVDWKMYSVYGYPKQLNRNVIILTMLFISAALGEYLLFIFYNIHKLGQTGIELNARNFYLLVFPEFFSVVAFQGFSAFLITITSLIGHMIWSYNDLFIIVISSVLALRFKQITDRLFGDEKKIKPNNYWIELRADYERLVRVSKKLDKYISYIVLLSYSANVFFLLVQLSNVIGHFNYLTEVVYYSYSFAFLIVRLTLVSLYGAWISEESKKPAHSLHGIAATTYNSEIRRFLFQISFNDVAITGSKMFKVTRGLLLNIAGAVVTYELVILQFNENAKLE